MRRLQREVYYEGGIYPFRKDVAFRGGFDNEREDTLEDPTEGILERELTLKSSAGDRKVYAVFAGDLKSGYSSTTLEMIEEPINDVHKYQRILKITVQPRNAPFPEGLHELLVDNGFKPRRPENSRKLK